MHSILNQLRAWQDELPPDIRVVERSTPRPVASLHLAYNQCIIQTTRPVLLHLFKLQFQLGTKSRDTTPQQGISSITLALAEIRRIAIRGAVTDMLMPILLSFLLGNLVGWASPSQI
ncbi:MAG: hypothetical protein EOP84_11370 [Verrucomicrobiaceae bacterium]|nr:MAG: hypothetical protein EOP84_11370 [Verrucomicrobiaceae bacterium]